MSSKKQTKAKGKDSAKELERELKETEEKLNSTINDLKRTRADFENHIKRTNKEKENLSIFSKQEIIKKLLPINDDFERAISSIKETEDKEKILEGIQMIFNQFSKLFGEEGIRPIESLGKNYDPYLHEVIKKIDSDKEEGVILEEIQRGYSFNNDALRPAKVIISNGKKEADENTISEARK
ncbi:MAG: nucleotide exchange factor GrpE [Candidatus Woesearchaeota archaeon]